VICADFNSDDTTFAACNADVNDNVAETTVTKTWVENFLTGGGRIGPDKKPPTYTFGGTIGVNPSTDETQPDFIGQWEINKHTTPIAACHFDTFASLVFSGPPTQSPPSNHNTADVNMSGTCTPSGIAVAGHLHVVDVGEPGNGADTIAYTCFVGCSTLPSFSGTLTGGNLQVHQILGP
jgi:hypothetical protein